MRHEAVVSIYGLGLRLGKSLYVLQGQLDLGRFNEQINSVYFIDNSKEIVLDSGFFFD